ncbi:RNA-binding protein 45-like [Galleria mellonella]|uniref:RNA-binding protein 45-like n=1 Tax=Galleria mellonella TaxID=7137 RepID=A0A6J1X2Y4_GALME|nr:RNA-binding protein 45-like [Galleria mellonella]
MDFRRKHKHEDNFNESPTYSRLFVVTEKKVTEEQLRDAFTTFGNVEDIRIPRDHNTGESKGIAYIKFSKTTEAAAALEEMNLKVLPNSNRPLKVMVAVNRSDIQTDDDYDEKYRRIFITIPKTMSEKEIKDEFSDFGHVEYIRIQRERNTGFSKGFAYVKYTKFSEAARAYEDCDPKYRAIFALPKSNNKRLETTFESNINSLAMSSIGSKTSLLSAMNVRPGNYTKVNFTCSPYLTQLHVERIFDIVPGMVHCQYYVDLMRNYGKGTASYSNPISATYAVEKLNKFEYPPGVKIFVRPADSKFDPHEKNFTNIPNAVSNLKNAITATASSSPPDLAQLAEAIAEASKLIKMATTGVSDEDMPDSNELNYCSVKLPSPQPLADIDSPVAKRCFLVCKPQPPPLTVLRDVFCRFGNLINVYTLPNKTVGYARYATAEAADEAIRVLHGAEICGVRMKVLEADDEAPPKRARYSEQSLKEDQHMTSTY